MLTPPSKKLFPIASRVRPALRAGGLHFALSAALVMSVAILVFWLWFPAPLRELMGGTELFWIIVSVDLVCGPLLTLIIFNPTKPRVELRCDLAIVLVLQLLALVYGLHTLSYVRPIALVHEANRFRVVSYADLDENDAKNIPQWANPWSIGKPRTMGVRPAVGFDEKWASVGASFQGVEPSQRPSWWQDYKLSVPDVLKRAQPLATLRAKHPQRAGILSDALSYAVANAAAGETTDPEELRWMPLVSRRVTDWVVLIDPVTARIRGHAHLDGF